MTSETILPTKFSTFVKTVSVLHKEYEALQAAHEVAYPHGYADGYTRSSYKVEEARLRIREAIDAHKDLFHRSWDEPSWVSEDMEVFMAQRLYKEGTGWLPIANTIDLRNVTSWDTHWLGLVPCKVVVATGNLARVQNPEGELVWTPFRNLRIPAFTSSPVETATS